MSATKRNEGIDLLRILSMFMIVNLHVLAQGGVMVRVTGHELPYYVCWFLETCAYCAVDCYGLISGYVGVESKYRPARILELWFQVFFYSAGITVLFWIFAPELLEADSFLKGFLPVSWKTYWYFSAYVGLFFLMPFLNRMINSMEEKELKKMALVLFLVFSAATALPKAYGVDFLSLGGGYSFVWLVILYLLGGCIRKCRWKRRKSRVYLLVYLGLVTFSWAFKILMENYTRRVYGEPRYGRLFTSYTAPTIFLCAVCLLLIFDRVKPEKPWMRRLISLASPLAFSVYLIHTHPLIFSNLLKGAFSVYRSLPVWLILPAVLGTSALIYAGCSLVDAVRKQLFSFLQIRRLSERLTGAVQNLWKESAGTEKSKEP